ncbi:hypothetical protein [Algisphaera agarilytica]|uniref:Uncharacterized protein n=1 Tax=Algisphaera agarilytica TaxID=1385975 RepID=A0A7X0H619_9BACT|nr:hypothetical protein [Algisphaera agarilytica]MBB6428454.1 hypothetical protein [Algisphaera agarilytica]
MSRPVPYESKFIDPEQQRVLLILADQGWVEAGAFVFKKNGYELVFDTSHYVELYELRSGERVHEARILGADDIAEFLRQIDV